MPSIPTLKSKSQRQVDLSEFKASPVYRSSRTARNTHRETTVSKYKNKKTKNKKGNIQPLLYYLLHSDSIIK